MATWKDQFPLYGHRAGDECSTMQYYVDVQAGRAANRRGIVMRAIRLIIICQLVFSMLGNSRAAENAPSTGNPAAPAIGIAPSDGFNLQIDNITGDQVRVRLTTPVHNWFAGTLTNLPTDRKITISLPMAGNSTRGNPANVAKWQGLLPVLTYADPTKYASYEWFTRDAEGRWISGDPLKKNEARYAGTEAVPAQQAIPPKLAAEFLSSDGTYWCPWRDVEEAVADTAQNTFRLSPQVAQSTATVAMRVPYTYTYQQAFLQRLTAAQLPGVFLDEIGTTAEGRKLQAIRLDDPSNAVSMRDRKTVVVIAREHATEHAAGWALLGMVLKLVEATPETQALRRGMTWIFIPLEDPDGSAHAVFDRLTEMFKRDSRGADTPLEVLAYARYLTDYAYRGRTIDVVMTLHGVEATESSNLCCPMVDPNKSTAILAFNHRLYAAVRQAGFQTEDPAKPWDYGTSPFRLYGWCAEHFESYDLTYEVNDRYPGNRLSLARLQGLGAEMAVALGRWCGGPEGEAWHRHALKGLHLKQLERAVYYQRAGYRPDKRMPQDIIRWGF
ncbi:MAG: M14 family zinc carboxypeptidase [Armatimonadota bacterium]